MDSAASSASEPEVIRISLGVPMHVYEKLFDASQARSCSIAAYVGSLIADAVQDAAAARPATAEDVRLMIREEIRAALADVCEQRNFGPRPERLIDIERRASTRAPTSWKV